MKVCYVTDRKALPVPAEDQLHLLLEKIEGAARAGVDWVQIREKDLCGRELAALVSEALRRTAGLCRILVNDRLDVAMACRAGGVHLGEMSMPAQEAKRFVRERNVSDGFLVGVSAHSLEAVRAAEKVGADYTIFGPVYETPSKTAYGQPQGIERIAEVSRAVAIPVIAIGGITLHNAGECVAAGASGIAAIRLFQDADDLSELVGRLHEGSSTHFS
jgi:thiamine-phosphate pyrophosphorylase